MGPHKLMGQENAHTCMGHPICVRDIPYVYETSYMHMGQNTHMGHSNRKICFLTFLQTWYMSSQFIATVCGNHLWMGNKDGSRSLPGEGHKDAMVVEVHRLLYQMST